MSKDTASTNDNQKDGEHPEGDVAPFDRWLDKKLKNAYGSVLEEAIPQDILDLLRKKLD